VGGQPDQQSRRHAQGLVFRRSQFGSGATIDHFARADITDAVTTTSAM
jgi:hypothetical protein